ncbi:MAG: glycosyltransferase family 2 protein [Candidatus Sedimenticola sp. (ex Thyasira tokunagai)]
MYHYQNKGNSPRVSVLIPVHNTAKHLCAALKSISDQTYQDFEMIVIDDGSLDGSVEILERYAEKEQRMNLIARENKGLIATRNELLERSTGQLIAWMDSDDISLPDRLQKQVEEFDKEQELACVGTALAFIDSSGLPISVKKFPLEHGLIRMAQKNGKGMQFATTMMMRSTAIGIGGFRMPFLMGEDFDFLLRLGEIGRLKNLPNILFEYRRHVKSTSSNLTDRWPAYRAVIIKLADERAMHGKDLLQRGEKLVIDFSGQYPTLYDSQVSVNLSIFENAFQSKNYKAALKSAIVALLHGYSRLNTWKLIMKTLLRGC